MNHWPLIYITCLILFSGGVSYYYFLNKVKWWYVHTVFGSLAGLILVLVSYEKNGVDGSTTYLMPFVMTCVPLWTIARGNKSKETNSISSNLNSTNSVD